MTNTQLKKRPYPKVFAEQFRSGWPNSLGKDGLWAYARTFKPFWFHRLIHGLHVLQGKALAVYFKDGDLL